MSSKCVFIFIFVLGACRTSALPVADVVRNIEDGVAKIGCDDASFTKAKPAVMKAISFFTQVNESKIACVDLSVQATGVDIYYMTLQIAHTTESGETHLDKKICRVLRERTAANEEIIGTKAFMHVDLATGKTEESEEEQARIDIENRYEVDYCTEDEHNDGVVVANAHKCTGTWGACTWGGSCCAGLTCFKKNRFYSQCRPGTCPHRWNCQVSNSQTAESENAKSPDTDQKVFGKADTCTRIWGGCTWGGKCCDGSTCYKQHAWYSQCRPGPCPQGWQCPQTTSTGRAVVRRGCYKIRTKSECCASHDGRARWASDCVPGSFGNGNVCEPRKWVNKKNKQGSANSCSGYEGCFESSVRYGPDMTGQGRTVTSSAFACQKRCASVRGCAFFSWWSDGGCHIQGSGATKKSSTGRYGAASAGPASCAAANTTTDKNTELLLETSSNRHKGHIRLSAEDWAKIPDAPEPTIEELQTLPTSFDERTAHPGCISYEIQDQGTCGSCWAFAASRVYGDRLCRASPSRWDMALSEQDVLSCYKSGGFYVNGGTQVVGPAGTWTAKDGCEGGNHLTTWIAQAESDGGRVARWADPYTGQGKDTDACGTVDAKSLKFLVTKGSINKIPSGAVDTIKTQIYQGGSVGAGMDIYTDFSTHRAGVYIKTSDSYSGAHAVALIGWGTDSGIDYWHFANSWGTGWGELGYGRIRRGTNEVKIEEEVSYMMPAVPSECSSSAVCAHGEFDKNCDCRCHGSWTGSACLTCTLSCANGGTLDSSSCSCSCPPGYSGTTCQEYLFGRWHSKNGDVATIEFTWKLTDFNEGSYVTRYANPVGTSGNPQIGGTRTDLAGGQGSFTANVASYQMVPGYPKAFFYAFMLSLGTNEFGASRGFKTIGIPGLYMESAAGKCLSGGNLPVAADVARELCAGAYTPAPQHASLPTAVPLPQQTTAPTEMPTEQPTHIPSATPTEVPTTLPPTTNRPSFAPTHTPTEHPTRMPSHSPTEHPTAVPTTERTAAPMAPSTASPTSSPSGSPSESITDSPTALPTALPSLAKETATACSGHKTLTAASGEVSDGAAGDYVNGHACSWLISPAGSAPLMLSFSSFDLEQGYDHLKVYDGDSMNSPLLASLHGTALPNAIKAASGKMFLTFETDVSVTAEGFLASYTTTAPEAVTVTPTLVPSHVPTITPTEPPTPSPTLTPTGPPTATASPTTSTPSGAPKQGGTIVCSGQQTLTAASGQVTEGSSGEYTSNHACQWLIAPSSGSAVTLHFASFHLEEDYDFLKVYDGDSASASLLANLHGSTKPDPITAESGKMFLSFTTDGSVNEDGFVASYSA